MSGLAARLWLRGLLTQRGSGSADRAARKNVSNKKSAHRNGVPIFCRLAFGLVFH